MTDEVRVTIREDTDLIAARAEGRALAERQGFSRTDTTLIATAISEIARNIVVHAGHGELMPRPVDDGIRTGLIVMARDEGPGMNDVEAAVKHGSATGGGLGLGLPGARRLMDEFQVVSARRGYDRDDGEVAHSRRARAAPRATEPTWPSRLSSGLPMRRRS